MISACGNNLSQFSSRSCILKCEAGASFECIPTWRNLNDGIFSGVVSIAGGKHQRIPDVFNLTSLTFTLQWSILDDISRLIYLLFREVAHISNVLCWLRHLTTTFFYISPPCHVLYFLFVIFFWNSWIESFILPNTFLSDLRNVICHNNWLVDRNMWGKYQNCVSFVITFLMLIILGVGNWFDGYLLYLYD